ncbi:peptidase M16 [Spirochaetota bacterium]|nr:peptidase M16 [Spirochaetota bacterium]
MKTYTRCYRGFDKLGRKTTINKQGTLRAKMQGEEAKLLLENNWPVRVFKLGNGLTIAIEEQFESEMAAFYLRVNTGSIHEVGYYGSGLSHLVEHAMFLGCKNIPEKDGFSHVIENLGGVDLNAYTTYDHTAYFATVFGTKLHLALRALLDFILYPRFPKRALIEEMGTIRSEMQMVEDRAGWVFHDYIQIKSYPRLPYAYPIIGFKEVFNKLTKAEVKRYHSNQYTPTNMILTLKGAVHTDKIIKFIKTFFNTQVLEYKENSDLVHQNHDNVSNHPSKSPQQKSGIQFKEQVAKLEHKVSQNNLIPKLEKVGAITHPRAKYMQIAYTWRTPVFGSKDDVLINLFGSFLTGGKSTPLYDHLKEKLALVHSIQAHAFIPVRYFKRDYGTFTLYLKANEKHPFSQNETTITTYIERITQELFDTLRKTCGHTKKLPSQTTRKLEQLLIALKNETIKEIIDERESLIETASNIAGSLHATGQTYYSLVYLNKVRELRLSDLLAGLNKYLLQAPYTLTVLKPHNHSEETNSRNNDSQGKDSNKSNSKKLAGSRQQKRVTKNSLSLPASRFKDHVALLRKNLKFENIGDINRARAQFKRSNFTQNSHLPKHDVSVISKPVCVKTTSVTQQISNTSQNTPKNAPQSTQKYTPKDIQKLSKPRKFPSQSPLHHSSKPAIKRNILANGTVFIAERKTFLPKVALVVRFKGGQAFEGEPFTKQNNASYIKQLLASVGLEDKSYIPYGAFAFLSRLTFTSNATYTKKALHQSLKTHAIDYETTSGSASFSFMLSYLKDKHDLICNVLSSILLRGDFKETDIAKERSDLIFHMRREQESLERLSLQAFNKEFYAGTPYSMPLKGTEKTIKTISPTLLNGLRKLFCTGANMVVSVKGDIEENEIAALKNLVRRLPAYNKNSKFPLLQSANSQLASKLKSHPRTNHPRTKNHNNHNNHSNNVSSKSPSRIMALPYPKYTLRPIASLKINNRFIKVTEPTAHETYYKLGFRAPTLKSRDALAMAVIKHHFSGMSGALFKLRSENFSKNGQNLGGRAYSLGCYSHTERNFGAFIFYAALRKEAKDEYLFMRTAFLAETEKLKKVLLTHKELLSAKDAIRATFMMHALALSYHASLETLYEIYGMHYLKWKQKIKLLATLTALDIKNIANKYFKTDAYFEHVIQGDRK